MFRNLKTFYYLEKINFYLQHNFSLQFSQSQCKRINYFSQFRLWIRNQFPNKYLNRSEKKFVNFHIQFRRRIEQNNTIIPLEIRTQNSVACILITYIQWFTEIGPKLSAINFRIAHRPAQGCRVSPHTQLPNDQNNRKIVEHTKWIETAEGEEERAGERTFKAPVFAAPASCVSFLPLFSGMCLFIARCVFFGGK